MTNSLTNVEPMQTYEPLDLAPYQSQYIHEGRFHERWAIDLACISGDQLDADIHIKSPYISPTDQGGFHLSFFAAHEFCSELILFWMFKKIGLANKAQEAWIRECHCKFISPIRSHRHIKVSLSIRRFRVINGMAYASGLFEITDDNNGLFLIKLSGGFLVEPNGVGSLPALDK